MKNASDMVSFALKNGADDVAIETIAEDTTQIKFANSSASAAQNWAGMRYGVFVAVKRATAGSTFQGLSEKELETTIKKLISAAKKSQQSKEYSGLAKGPFKYKPVNGLYDKKIADYNGAEAVETAINAASCRSAAGFFYKSEIARSVETSAGACGTEKKTKLQLSIRAFNEPDESGHALSCGRMLKDFRPEEAGKQAGETARLAKDPVQGKAGKCDIIFAPMAIGNLLSRVGEFSVAFNVDSGFSCFGGKLGARVASNIVNIKDNGRLENGFNSSIFDDEGVPTMETDIINSGMLKSYLHNTSSAKKYKTKTTANAGIIAQHYSNIVMEPGGKTREKLLSSIDKGLLVTNVWYTRFQSFYDGDFSTIPRDGILVIDKGGIVGSINNIRITENLLNMLQNIEDLSNTLACVQWWEEINPPVYTPYVLVKSVNVTLPTM